MERSGLRRHTAATPNKILHQTGKDPAGEKDERATMEEKELSLEGILRHLTPITIKAVIAELKSAIESKWLDEFKPGKEIVAARDAAIAYMKRVWPEVWEE